MTRRPDPFTGGQPSLFDKPAAGAGAALGPSRPNVRTSDPHTSRDAAASLDPATLGRQQAAVIASLAARREATCEEIAGDVGNYPNRVARRITDLHDLGLVADTGSTRAASSGRQQIVWHLTDAGRARAQEIAA